MNLDQLFELFLREKLFLDNVSSRTIRYFQWCFTSFKKYYQGGVRLQAPVHAVVRRILASKQHTSSTRTYAIVRLNPLPALIVVALKSNPPAIITFTGFGGNRAPQSLFECE